jgi:hypothetical protein
MRRWILPVVLLGSLGMGCGSRESGLESLRPATETKLKAVETVAALARSSLSFSSGQFDLQGGPEPDFPPGRGPGAAVALDSDDLADLTTSKGRMMVKVNPIADVASWCRKGVLSSGFKPAKHQMNWFENEVRRFIALRYVLVLRTTGGVQPSANSGAMFQGGAWRGRAELFDLEKALYVGDMPFEAQNDQTVKVNVGKSTPDLLDNLRKNAFTDLRARFKSRFPGGEPPFGPPVGP